MGVWVGVDVWVGVGVSVATQVRIGSTRVHKKDKTPSKITKPAMPATPSHSGRASPAGGGGETGGGGSSPSTPSAQSGAGGPFVSLRAGLSPPASSVASAAWGTAAAGHSLRGSFRRSATPGSSAPGTASDTSGCDIRTATPVTLSAPPRALARSTRCWTASVRGPSLTASPISSSVTRLVRPSLHRTRTSPAARSRWKRSASIVGVLPSDRVMTLR